MLTKELYLLLVRGRARQFHNYEAIGRCEEEVIVSAPNQVVRFPHSTRREERDEKVSGMFYLSLDG